MANEYLESIDKFKEIFNDLVNKYNANKHDQDYIGIGWEFNVKLHNLKFPIAYRTLIRKYPELEDESIELFHTFLTEKANTLISDLETTFKWIEYGFRVGRQGGWLVVVDSEFGDFKDNLDDIELMYDTYKDNIREVEEELQDMILDAWGYLDARIKDLKRIQEYITEYISNLGDWFYEYLEDSGIIHDYTTEQ